MKRLLKWIGGIIAIVAIVIGAAIALYLYTPASYENRLSAVQRAAERGVSAGHWPGVMWAIVQSGEVITTGAAGFADVGAGIAMNPETIMPIGSITKVLAGLAASIAATVGLLDLDAPINDVLQVPFDPKGGAARSFAHLATHTSGIIDIDAVYEEHGYHYGSATHPMPLADFLSQTLGADGDLYQPALFGDWMPGTRYVYSNIGAGLAGQVIADAVGQPYADFTTERIVAPLNLSGFWGHIGPAPGTDPAQAVLYDRDETGAFAALPPYGLATWPDGQFNASATDLARMVAVMMGDGVLDGQQVLPAAAVQMQKTPRVADIPGKDTQGDFIGLFWERETLTVGPIALTLEGHSGGDPGVITFMYRTPGHPTGFVLMFNGEPEGTMGLLAIVRMARLLAGMPLPD